MALEHPAERGIGLVAHGGGDLCDGRVAAVEEIDGEVKEHRFIRADRFASKDDAVDTSLRKARQIIDEQGERSFSFYRPPAASHTPMGGARRLPASCMRVC